jgi:hypothetical protein
MLAKTKPHWKRRASMPQRAASKDEHAPNALPTEGDHHESGKGFEGKSIHVRGVDVSF